MLGFWYDLHSQAPLIEAIIGHYLTNAPSNKGICQFAIYFGFGLKCTHLLKYLNFCPVFTGAPHLKHLSHFTTCFGRFFLEKERYPQLNTVFYLVRTTVKWNFKHLKVFPRTKYGQLDLQVSLFWVSLKLCSLTHRWIYNIGCK